MNHAFAFSFFCLFYCVVTRVEICVYLHQIFVISHYQET